MPGLATTLRRRLPTEVDEKQNVADDGGQEQRQRGRAGREIDLDLLGPRIRPETARAALPRQVDDFARRHHAVSIGTRAVREEAVAGFEDDAATTFARLGAVGARGEQISGGGEDPEAVILGVLDQAAAGRADVRGAVGRPTASLTWLAARAVAAAAIDVGLGAVQLQVDAGRADLALLLEADVRDAVLVDLAAAGRAPRAGASSAVDVRLALVGTSVLAKPGLAAPLPIVAVGRLAVPILRARRARRAGCAHPAAAIEVALEPVHRLVEARRRHARRPCVGRARLAQVDHADVFGRAVAPSVAGEQGAALEALARTRGQRGRPEDEHEAREQGRSRHGLRLYRR